MPNRSAFVSVLLGLSLVGCAEPLQNGGVHMFAGADARFEAMCRFRRNGDGQQSSCVPPATEVASATAKLITSESQFVRGPRAEGAAADVLLTNGEISVIIGGQNSPRRGAIIDVADAHVGQDELGGLTPCVAVAGGDCLPLGVPALGHEADGRAWIEVGLAEPGALQVVTRYSLLPGARSLHISTIVTSSSAEPLSLSRLDDVVVLGSLQPMVPSGETQALVAVVGSRVAYGVMPMAAHTDMVVATNEGTMAIRHAREAVVSAGHEVRRDRVLVVAPRGDSLGVLTELSFLRSQQPPGAIELRLVRPDGALLPHPEGSRIRLVSQVFPIDAFWSLGLPEEGVPLAAEAPAGKYTLDYEGPGRHAAAMVPVTVRPGEITQATIVLEENAPVAVPVP